jgi:hypothetical protein
MVFGSAVSTGWQYVKISHVLLLAASVQCTTAALQAGAAAAKTIMATSK